MTVNGITVEKPSGSNHDGTRTSTQHKINRGSSSGERGIPSLCL